MPTGLALLLYADDTVFVSTCVRPSYGRWTSNRPPTIDRGCDNSPPPLEGPHPGNTWHRNSARRLQAPCPAVTCHCLCFASCARASSLPCQAAWPQLQRRAAVAERRAVPAAPSPSPCALGPAPPAHASHTHVQQNRVAKRHRLTLRHAMPGVPMHLPLPPSLRFSAALPHALSPAAISTLLNPSQTQF